MNAPTITRRALWSLAEATAGAERVVVIAEAREAYAYWAASLAACRADLDAALQKIAALEMERDLRRAHGLRGYAGKRLNGLCEAQASSSRPTITSPAQARRNGLG